jgi:uncharacterized protein
MDIFTEISLNDLNVLANQDKSKFNKLIKRLQKIRKQELDEFVHNLHNELFADTDCLKCANCCKTLGPMITDVDINRMAKYLKMKPGTLTEKYLEQDEKGYFVFQTLRCPFLLDDNYCMIYEARPKACREYPHTDMIHFQKILSISLKNTETCPVVYKIFKCLNEKYG